MSIKTITEVVSAVVAQTHDDGQKTTQQYQGCDGTLLCELTADQMYLVDYTLYGANVALTNQAILLKRLTQ